MATEDFNTIMKWVAWVFPGTCRLTCWGGWGLPLICDPAGCLSRKSVFLSSSDACCLFFRQLFSYITKERQTESLVEKLCQRFRTAKWVHPHFFSDLHSSPVWSVGLAGLSRCCNKWPRTRVLYYFITIVPISMWKGRTDTSAVGLWLMLHPYSKEGHFKLHNGKVNLGTRES